MTWKQNGYKYDLSRRVAYCLFLDVCVYVEFHVSRVNRFYFVVLLIALRCEMCFHSYSACVVSHCVNLITDLAELFVCVLDFRCLRHVHRVFFYRMSALSSLGKAEICSLLKAL